MTKDYLPHSFAGLLSWLIHFLSHLLEHATRFGIPPEQIEALQVLVNEFQTAQDKAEDPNAGKADHLKRKEVAKAAAKSARHLVNAYLRYNDAVTDEDRTRLGLRVADTTPTQIAVPATMPETTVDSSIIMRLTLHYRDSGSTSRGKPAGIHGCEIRWSILPEPPSVTDELRNSEFSTRAPHTFVFEENQRGKTVYFRLRWENARGQKGPWSELYTGIVP